MASTAQTPTSSTDASWTVASSTHPQGFDRTGFSRDDAGQAQLGGTRVTDLLEQAGVRTPAYFYDLDGVAQTVRALVAAFGAHRHLIAYAVKANSAGSIVRAVHAAGGGADVVSGGELRSVLRCGIPPARIVMSGVAKTDDEIDLAISSGIMAIQAESVREIERIVERARTSRRTAHIGLRINPSVTIDSHAHVATGHDAAKFGIARADLAQAWATIDASGGQVECVGVSAHVGSMLTEPGFYLQSARAVCDVVKVRRAQGKQLTYIDFGGGFGIDYGDRSAAAPHAFARAAVALLEEQGLADLTLVVEPGRSIVGPYGILVARVVQTKQSGERRWLLIDAGMNDLLRPALYGAPHRIEAVDHTPGNPPWRVVGPVCESTDDFGEHPVGEAPEYVVIRDAGAYAFSMASEYNGRPLPAEVFVEGGQVKSVSESPGVDSWVERRVKA